MTIAIIIAGGSGKRMGQDIPKQFLNVYDKPVLMYTLEGFQRHPEIDAISILAAGVYGTCRAVMQLPEEKRPHACLQCHACTQVCPQGIAIPDVLADLAALYDKYPKWSEICEQRNRLAEQK